MKHELYFLIKDRAALLWMTIAFISAMMAVLLGLNDRGNTAFGCLRSKAKFMKRMLIIQISL